MAARSVAPSGVTTSVPFCSVSVQDANLFSVRPGVPVEDALGYASSVLEVAKWLALEACHHQKGYAIDGLIHCLDAAKAVVDAAFLGMVSGGEESGLTVVSK